MLEDFLTKGVCSIVVMTIAILLFMFWIVMLIDCARRTFRSSKRKILWILFIALTQTMGAFIYWLTIYRKV